MIEARLGILRQAATRFGKEALILVEEPVETALPLLKRRRIAHVSDQRFERGPGLRGHMGGEGLHRVKPVDNQGRQHITGAAQDGRSSGPA